MASWCSLHILALLIIISAITPPHTTSFSIHRPCAVGQRRWSSSSAASLPLAGKLISRCGDLNQGGEEEAATTSFSDDPEYWRVERALLEHQSTQAILNRKRLFLPYVDACLWVRTFGFSSKEDWEEWLEMGGKPGPYYTRDPEAYYTQKGSWRGWDHFLGLPQRRGEDPFTIVETAEHDEVD